MIRILTTYLIGVTFGAGIIISGMSNPAKVMNFFDFAGTWDPSLIFVMVTALVVTFVGYRLVFRRPAPTFEAKFQVPTNRKLDARLIGGAATFGIGWGLAGFCPGGLLPVISTLQADVLYFAAALLAGMFGTRAAIRVLDARKSQTA